MRNQFNGLQEEIDDRPDFGNLGTIITDQTAGNVSTMANLSLSVSNPPTPGGRSADIPVRSNVEGKETH